MVNSSIDTFNRTAVPQYSNYNLGIAKGDMEPYSTIKRDPSVAWNPNLMGINSYVTMQYEMAMNDPKNCFQREDGSMAFNHPGVGFLNPVRSSCSFWMVG